MTEKEYGKMTDSEKKKEDWMNSKWRPMMGWMYMMVCFFDFILAPILWSLVQTLGHGQVNVQWQPLTLQGAGLFHISMGAVLGIAAYGRTQEKLNGANNGGVQLPATGTTYTPPAPMGNQPIGGMNNGGFNTPSGGATAFGAAPAGGFGGGPSGFGTPAPSTPASNFGGGFGSAPSAPAATGFGGNSGFGATTTPALTASGKKIVPTDPDPEL